MNWDEIVEIIKKYIELWKKAIEKEEYITTTELVPHNFFEKEEKNVLKDFGTVTILFNDLKKSTKLIEELERQNKLFYYSSYIYYSSKMLSEILDLFDGKMVECTGDGNYSIFKNINKQVCKDFYETYSYYYKSHCRNKRNDFYCYLSNFDKEEIKFLKIRPHYQYHNYKFCKQFSIHNDKIIRKLFFHIFAHFNIEINKVISDDFYNQFLTRIGCYTGNCKITRIENGHIKQDKLIGTVVHISAHQASGKI